METRTPSKSSKAKFGTRQNPHVVTTTIAGYTPELSAAQRRADADRQIQIDQKKAARRSARNRLIATATGAGMLLGAGVGVLVKGRVDAINANNAQPACDVPVKRGTTIDGIRQNMSASGDSEVGTVHAIMPNGRERTPKNTPNFYVAGAMGIQPGDVLEFEHVDPAVCIAVEGAPELPQPQPNQNSKQ